MALQNTSKIAITSFALFSVSLLLASYSARNEWVGKLGPSIVGEVLRPVQSVVSGVSGSVQGLWSNYIMLVGVQEENMLLRERIEALETENSRLIEGESELLRLRQILGTAQDYSIQGIAADVIGYDPSNWVRAVTIGKGSRHNVSIGMAVISGDSIVGQVVGVSPNTARVLLITDHSSGVDALIQSSRARGVLQGLGRDNCDLRYVSQDSQVALGDRVVASGMDGIFPKGLMLGVVSEVRETGDGMFKSIRVKPAANLSKLETVLIVTLTNTPDKDELPPLTEGGK